MKSILIPTDFSDCAAAAYSYASCLAEKTNATIYLLHILDVSFPSIALGGEAETTLDTPFMIELMKLTQARMKKVKSRKEFKNILDVREVIEVGPIPERIFNAVEKYNIEMIVMGTHGANGFQEKFLGTNAEKVVRNAEIPVLSIKHIVKKPKIETILFATDFSKETEEVLPTVNDISKLFGAKLILTKVVTPNNFEASIETEKQIKKFKAKNSSYKYLTNVYYANSKEDGIRYAAETAGANMIALGTHGRHGLAHFFRGSIAEDVVSHVPLPVLTINFHRERIIPKPVIREKKVREYDSDLLYQIPSV